MTIEVSGDIERLIEAAVASRRFANAGEFVSAMAELWQERERSSNRGDLDATAYAALATFFVLVLVTLAAADLRYRLVPNRIVLPAAVVVLGAHTAIDPSFEWVVAAFAASLDLA